MIKSQEYSTREIKRQHEGRYRRGEDEQEELGVDFKQNFRLTSRFKIEISIA